MQNHSACKESKEYVTMFMDSQEVQHLLKYSAKKYFPETVVCLLHLLHALNYCTPDQELFLSDLICKGYPHVFVATNRERVNIPVNNFSVVSGRSSWVKPVPSTDKSVLLKDTTQWRRWGSNLQPLNLESSTLPLSSCAPWTMKQMF